MRDIRGDRAHSEIIDCCLQLLEAHASFEFTDVLKRTGYELMAKSIRWDRVRKAIEKDHSMTLWPAVKRFFHLRSDRYNRDRLDPNVQPDKFLAGTGTGKKVAGYFRVSKENGRMVLYRLQRSQAEIDGKTQIVKQLTAEATKVGVIGPPVTS